MHLIHQLLGIGEKFKDPASNIKTPWIRWGLRIIFFSSVILSLYFSTIQPTINKSQNPPIPLITYTNSSGIVYISELTHKWKVEDYHLLEVITYLSTLLGSCAGVWTYLIKPSLTVCKKAKKTYEQIEYISEQLRPNGGGSTYDIIKNTAASVNLHTSSIRKLENRTEKIHELVIITSAKSHILFDQEPIAMYECDMDGKCIWTNSSLQQLFGLTHVETLGDGWLAALHPDDIRETYDNWMATIKNWIPYRVRYRVINSKTKTEYLVEATAQIVKCEVGKPLTVIGTVTVIK